MGCCCRREALAHLQQAESLQIRRDSDAFQARVDAYRAFFQKAAPFAAPEGSLNLAQVCTLLSEIDGPAMPTFTCSSILK